MSWSGYIPGSLLREMVERGEEKERAMNVYRERAALVAFLAKFYPAWLAYNDPDEPDWAVCYIETGEGQLSWHIAPDDMDLFNGIDFVRTDPPAWDGHSTAEKYARLARLDPAADLAVIDR